MLAEIFCKSPNVSAKTSAFIRGKSLMKAEVLAKTLGLLQKLLLKFYIFKPEERFSIMKLPPVFRNRK